MDDDGRVEQPKPSNLGSLSKSGNNEREQTRLRHKANDRGMLHDAPTAETHHRTRVLLL